MNLTDIDKRENKSTHLDPPSKLLTFLLYLGGVPQSSRPGFSESSGNTPYKVGEEKCEESKVKMTNFGKD